MGARHAGVWGVGARSCYGAASRSPCDRKLVLGYNKAQIRSWPRQISSFAGKSHDAPELRS